MAEDTKRQSTDSEQDTAPIVCHPQSTLHRRGLIAGAAALIAGIAAKRTAEPVSAGGMQGTALICGDNTNTATQITALTSTSNPSVGLLVDTSNNGQNPIGRAIRGISGIGVEGWGSTGVSGQGLSNGSTGVSGTVNQGVSSGTGVSGSADLYGVQGTASGTYSTGVFGTSTGSFGAGVVGTGHWGISGGGTSIGVVGGGNVDGATGVLGTATGNGIGVWGEAASGPGVVGTATSGHGVEGISTSGHGVLGQSSTGYGVLGYSTGGPASLSGISTNVNIPAFAGGNSQANGLAAHFNGGVFVDCATHGGQFVVNPMTAKSGLLAHPDGSHRLMYSMEAPESWAEDFGRAQLVGGKAEVKLDADFAALVHTEDYHVFLTPHADTNGLHVTQHGATSFTVQEHKSGTASLTFSWRVVAKPKTDHKAERLAKFAIPNVKYPDTATLPKPAAPPKLPELPKKP